MLINRTNLEYSEADEVALLYYMGGNAETIEQYGQRIFSIGTFKGRTALELWEEKKSNRRERLLIDLGVSGDSKNDADILACKSHQNYITRDEYDANLKYDNDLQKYKSENSKKERVEKLKLNGLSDDVIIALNPSLQSWVESDINGIILGDEPTKLVAL